jgi:hypothetical protein
MTNAAVATPAQTDNLLSLSLISSTEHSSD